MNNKQLNGSLRKFTFIFVIGLSVNFSAHTAQSLDIRPYDPVDSCSVDRMQIRVTINGVGAGGILSVGLYNDPEHFLKKKGRKQRIRIPVMASQHTVCFDIKQPGTYAVAVYHDVDGNHKLRKRWNMTPNEPFGLSNNPEQHFGFPKFRDSAFTANDSGANIMINLRQP